MASQLFTFKAYAHLRVGPADGTEVVVAGINGDCSKYGYGSVLVFDDPLTATEDSSSEKVGRAKGFGASTDSATGYNNTSLYVTFCFSVGGVCKGNIVVVGTTDKADTERELAIVGGTGEFRFARGVATQRTIRSSVDATGATVSTNVWTFTLYTDTAAPSNDSLSSKLSSLAVST